MKFKSQKNQIRQILEDRISNDFKDREVCVWLSGGADSTLIALICKSLGKKVTSISYHLDGITNWDCEKAEEISDKNGFDFHKVIVPFDDPKSWFLKLIREYECTTKIQLECLYPSLFMVKKSKELGFEKVLSGFSSPFPHSRKGLTLFKNNPNKFWKDQLIEEYDSVGTKKVFEGSLKEGIKITQYLNDPKIIEIMTEFTEIKDLMDPYPKHFLKDIFREEFEAVDLLKVKAVGLQSGGSIQSFFEPLLSDPTINYRGYLAGNETNKISQLVKLWSSNHHPDEKPYPVIRKFEPYSLEDMRKESDKKLFTVVTTFSGGGGSSVGYKLGGGKVLLMNEFIEEGVKTYLLNHPNTPHEMIDLRKVTRKGGRKYVIDWFKKFGVSVGNYDILDGSPPCSTFSTSGKGQTKNEKKNVQYSETTQSRIGMLIHDFVYMVNCTKPKICIIENVPQIQSSDIFQYSLERLRKRGYKVNYSVMCSSHFGVPQRRRRLIVIGIRGDVCKKIGLKKESAILDLYPKGSIYEPTIRDGLEGVTVDRNERNVLLTSMVKSSTYELLNRLPKNPPKGIKLSHIDPSWTSDFNLVRSSMDHPSPTLTQMGQQLGRGGICHPLEDRVFSIEELKRLMGLPTDYILSGSFNQKAERMGRMVTPPIYKYLSKSLYENVLVHTKDMVYEIKDEG